MIMIGHAYDPYMIMIRIWLSIIFLAFDDLCMSVSASDSDDDLKS